MSNTNPTGPVIGDADMVIEAKQMALADMARNHRPNGVIVNLPKNRRIWVEGYTGSQTSLRADILTTLKRSGTERRDPCAHVKIPPTDIMATHGASQSRGGVRGMVIAPAVLVAILVSTWLLPMWVVATLAALAVLGVMVNAVGEQRMQEALYGVLAIVIVFWFFGDSK